MTGNIPFGEICLALGVEEYPHYSTIYFLLIIKYYNWEIPKFYSFVLVLNICPFPCTALCFILGFLSKHELWALISIIIVHIYWKFPTYCVRYLEVHNKEKKIKKFPQGKSIAKGTKALYLATIFKYNHRWEILSNQLCLAQLFDYFHKSQYLHLHYPQKFFCK